MRGNPQIDLRFETSALASVERFEIWDFRGNPQIDRLAGNKDISASASAGGRDRTFAANCDDNNGKITVEFL
ncbi:MULTISPECIES: hypothetical protein [unclassified Microcoleus]|uniref:hypothetical protein n=1 Tax=unclassified Microcoleus TaxID=2642155 RepID=UPI002FD11CCF